MYSLFTASHPKPFHKQRKFIVIVLTIILLPSIVFFGCASRKLGAQLPKGNIEVPVKRSIHFNAISKLQQEIIQYWSRGKVEDWVDGEKIDLKNPRTVISCLLAGKRIAEINQYLLLQKSTGNNGTRWLLNPRGGYDFNDMAFTPLLYLFNDRPDLLYPATKHHLVENILTIEGAGFTKNVPRLGFQDSENHILMAESSRYLKNQWRWNNGNQLAKYDNLTNGVGEGLLKYLKEIYTYGIYEFNSDPYLGYTYSSLLNLNAFATGEVKEYATKILDNINWQYALSSFHFKHFPPYRRRFKDSFSKSIYSDYHSVMLMVWASFYNDSLALDITHGKHHALWPSMLPYRPSDKVMEWTLNKPNAYFVKMGHGYNSCPEICSGDKTFLLTAGGANQGRFSLIMAKPTVLFLEDNARQLNQTFHMFGPGPDFMKWNNTGLYEDFACTKGMVHIPEGKKSVLISNEWQLFNISDSIFLCVYSKKELGLMVIVRAPSAKEAIEKILFNNNDTSILFKQFKHPNGNLIEYDLDAPKDRWVITSINNKPVNRVFDRWPFFEGNMDAVKK